MIRVLQTKNGADLFAIAKNKRNFLVI